jgi:hypothetical protein
MSRTEVKAKKIVERLKSLLWRSGELFRSISMRKHRRTADFDEHWSENGESLHDLRIPVEIGGYDAGRTVMTRPDVGMTQSTVIGD